MICSIIVTKVVYALFIRTCDCYYKEQQVLKLCLGLKTLIWWDCFGLFRWYDLITQVVKTGKLPGCTKRDVMMEQKEWVKVLVRESFTPCHWFWDVRIIRKDQREDHRTTGVYGSPQLTGTRYLSPTMIWNWIFPIPKWSRKKIIH